MMFYLVITDAYLTLSIASVTIYISPTFSNGVGEIKSRNLLWTDLLSCLQRRV